MKFDFKSMTQDELINYVEADEGCSCDNYKAVDLYWIYVPEFVLSNMGEAKAWIEWIDKEQEMFNKEMPYDRYKEIEEYWIPDPTVELIIAVKKVDGTYDIWDGNHRTGISFRKELICVPVILGNKKQDIE